MYWLNPDGDVGPNGEREIESERLIIEEWLLIPIYMETLDGVRGKDGAGQRPTEIYSWGGIFIGPPTRHMSDWRLKLHFQFGIAICSTRCMVTTNEHSHVR